MASRLFNQFVSSLNFNLCYIEGAFQVGAAGAVVPNSAVGNGLTSSSTLSAQNMGVGLYALRLADDYNRLVGVTFDAMPPLSSSAIPDGSVATLNVPYQIINASTATNWYTLGLNRALTPAPGVPFVATSGASNIPGSSTSLVGNGTMAAIGVVNFDQIELLPNINQTLSPTSAVSGVGGAQILFQTTLSSSATGTAGARVRVNPSSGTWIRYNLFLRNSSRGGYNESSSTN